MTKCRFRLNFIVYKMTLRISNPLTTYSQADDWQSAPRNLRVQCPHIANQNGDHL